MYRVLYKHYSEVNKNLNLVEADIEADDFTVIEGCLVLRDEHGKSVWGVPPTFWIYVVELKSPSLINP